MRTVTRLSASQQKRVYRKDEGTKNPGRPKKGDEASSKNDAHIVTPSHVKLAKRYKVKSRLCGDLTAISHHINQRVQMKHDQVCSYCGEPAYTRCMVCPEKPALHFYPSKGPNMGKSCFLDYHNDCCFSSTPWKAQSEWSPPSEKQKKENSKHIRKIVADEAEGTNH
jgi:hypothetical protein